MPLQLRATRLPLAQIDLNDDTFALTIPDAPAADPGLEASIAEIGILHPPIVQEKANSLYRVVAGVKRLRAISTTRTACDCLLLAANTSPTETLAAAFAETRASRPPTALEKALFLNKGLRWLDEEQVARRFLPMLGEKGDLQQLRQHLQLLQLEEPLLLALQNGTLDESVARDLAEMSFIDRMTLFDLISLLTLSVDDQRKLVTGCREVAKRNGTNITAVLDDQDLNAILNHEASTPPQKAEQLMSWLADHCSPRQQAAEKEFQAFRAQFALPQGVTLHHVQSFAEDTVTMEVTFANREQLERLWPSLREILVDKGED
ncbi:MAG: ParB/Srx family N-terminal domain-containing protein [Desulfobulbaceae bacterium]|nr:ParB/Srx family N-terminal domain-containing protein [Desulfobulbaceae bacterium]